MPELQRIVRYLRISNGNMQEGSMRCDGHRDRGPRRRRARKMLCQAASPTGLRVAVPDPLPDCPAGKIAFHHHIGYFKDMQVVREFAKGCRAFAVEIELVDVEMLEVLAKENSNIKPKLFTIRIIQGHDDKSPHWKEAVDYQLQDAFKQIGEHASI